MSEDIAKKHGVPYFRSAVGEANVVGGIRRLQAAIGGEGNGGVIDPRVGMVRDSFAGMALTLLLSRADRPGWGFLGSALAITGASRAARVLKMSTLASQCARASNTGFSMISSSRR